MFARGLNGMVLFGDDRDREHLLELFGETVDRYRIEIHAFVLMDSHYHAVVCTPEGNLSRAMQWLNLSYAAWYNTRHQRKGPVFQRPFGSVPVQDAAWAYELSLYVHLNPLRIKALGLSKAERRAANQGMSRAPSRQEVTARLQKLRQYRWSSYRAYAGYERAPEWLQTEALWRRASRAKAERIKTYRKDTQGRARQGGDPSQGEALRDSLAIGSSAFTRRVKELGAEVALNRETAGKRRLRERVSLEQVTEAVARARAEDWDELAERWGDPGAGLAMWIARRCTGLTLREIGQGVGGRDYAAVAMAIRRMDTRLGHDKALRAQAAQICKLLNVKMSPQ